MAATATATAVARFKCMNLMDMEDCDYSSLIPELRDQFRAGKPNLVSHLKALDLPLQHKMNAVFLALFEHATEQFPRIFLGQKDIIIGLVAHMGDRIKAQLIVLHAFEFFCNKVATPEQLAGVYWIFKGLRHVSFLDDDVCYPWYRDGSTGVNKDSPVWKAVQPFADYYLDESCLCP